MSVAYRPLTDTIIPARPKLLNGKRLYGAYPAGSVERFRAMLGVHIDDPVLHVCGGHVRHYPYRHALGPNDKTLDLNPEMEPDYLQDARDAYPTGFRAIMADPPYGEQHAAKYATGAENYPDPHVILRRSLEALEPGRRVGILHFCSPRPPRAPEMRLVGVLTVWLGWDMQVRVFTVYERLAVASKHTGSGAARRKEREKADAGLFAQVAAE